MEYPNCTRKDGWVSMAIAGAVILAAMICGGCLYTLVPAMAGPSTTYQQPAADQSTQSAQSSNDQTNQNKQQNGTQQNGAQSQGSTP